MTEKKTKTKATRKTTKYRGRFRKIPPLALLTFMVIMAELLVYTWSQVQCVQTGYAINDKVRRQQELKILNNSLKIELAHLKAPETLSRIARTQLALGMPDPKQIVVVP